jgi:hypothetical protein
VGGIDKRLETGQFDLPQTHVRVSGVFCPRSAGHAARIVI